MEKADMNKAIMKVVETNLDEISDDEIGIGLCGIVSDGRRRYHLEGASLVDFVRSVVVGIVAGGATPQDPTFVTPGNPRGLGHFGSDTPEEIADGIVAAWVAKGMPDPEWGDWRFNTAENRAYLDEYAEDMRRIAEAKRT